MKKLISLLLALTMVFSLAICASASEVEGGDGEGSTPTPSDPYDGKLDQPGIVAKKYTITNGTAPAEEFTFKFEGVSYVNNDGVTVTDATIPAIPNQTINFAEAISSTTDKTTTFTITAADYNLGVYTYKVTEVAPADAAKTSGTTYSEEELYLVLTIVRDEKNGKHYVAAMHYESATSSDKTTGFENTYNAGNLTVKKTIAGNMADMSDKFNFKVTLTDPEGNLIKSDIKLDGTSWEYTADDTVEITFSLGHGEEAVITNIPATVTYTVVETDANTNGYTMTETEADGSIAGGDNDVWSFTNTRTNEVDTGISLDSMPFVLILAVCAGAAVLFITKRRSVEF